MSPAWYACRAYCFRGGITLPIFTILPPALLLPLLHNYL